MPFRDPFGSPNSTTTGMQLRVPSYSDQGRLHSPLARSTAFIRILFILGLAVVAPKNFPGTPHRRSIPMNLSWLRCCGCTVDAFGSLCYGTIHKGLFALFKAPVTVEGQDVSCIVPETLVSFRPWQQQRSAQRIEGRTMGECPPGQSPGNAGISQSFYPCDCLDLAACPPNHRAGWHACFNLLLWG